MAEEHWPGKRLYNPNTGRYIGRYQGQMGSETILIRPVKHGVDQPHKTEKVKRDDVAEDSP